MFGYGGGCRCGCGGRGGKGAEGAGMRLSHARAGRKFRVSGIEGGRGLCSRMAAMGIYPGVEMEVLCAGCGSPCLVRVNGGTLSLGVGVSDQILVTDEA